MLDRLYFLNIDYNSHIHALAILNADVLVNVLAYVWLRENRHQTHSQRAREYPN